MFQAFLGSCFALAPALGAVAQVPVQRTDWYELDREVVRELQSRDVGAWARELGGAAPTTERELVTAFDVALRAGHRELVVQLIERLAVAPTTDVALLSALANELIGRERWDLARTFLEHLPTAEPGWGYVMLRAWREEGGGEEIDRWLVERQRAAPASDYWLAERLRHRLELRTGGELFAELEGAARAAPSDLRALRRCLKALQVLGTERYDLDWLGEVARPRLALDAYLLGQELARLEPSAARHLLERSLELPFTDEDRERMLAMPYSAMAFEPESALRGSTRHTLMGVYQRIGESERAQALLEQLADEYPDGVPAVAAALAGQIQGSTGARVIEGRILDAEPEQGDTVEHWLTRGHYYAGRGEPAEARRAFERALELATVDAGAELELAVFQRSRIIDELGRWFVAQGDVAARDSLLRRELGAADPGGLFAYRLVGQLLHWRSDFPRLDDELLWRYLAARDPWGHTEQRVLHTLADGLDAGQRDQLWKRAVPLAEGRADRSSVLGWVMTRAGADDRALALLSFAAERLEDARERESATFALFEAHLALGDWSAAEALWPSVSGYVHPDAGDWLLALARAAARRGALDDALGFWRRRANLDRGDLTGLAELADAGLRERLVSFYRELAESDPACHAPASALATLGGQ